MNRHIIGTAILVVFLVGCGGGTQTHSPDMDAENDANQSDLLDASATDEAGAEDIVSPGVPCIQVTPSPVDFHGKVIGKSAQIDVEIKSCGTAPLVITNIALLGGVDDVFPVSPYFDLNYSKLPDGVKPSLEAPLVIAGGDSALLIVWFTPGMENPLDPVTGDCIKDRGRLVIANNTDTPHFETDVVGYGILPCCPLPIIEIEEGEEVPPQTILHLSGEKSEGSCSCIPVISYHWTVDQPEENKFNLFPGTDFPNPTHEVNVSGTYTYCLDVCEASFCTNEDTCNLTACKKVEVVPTEMIHCELTWETPGDLNPYDEGPDAGADMDLHFLHPFATGPDLDGDGKPDGWFDLTYDCFWYNPSPDLESMRPNVKDDPSMDRDDTDGAGPENVNLDVPVDGRLYKIGVHYWDDHGYGPSYPTVKCWIAGQQVFEKDLMELGVPMNECDLWEVASIEWDSGKVTSIQDDQGDLKITSCYGNPTFGQIVGKTCCP